MQTIQDFAGSTDMWSTSAGGHLMKVVNLTGFTVYVNWRYMIFFYNSHINILLKANLQLKHVAATYNCNSDIVH